LKGFGIVSKLLSQLEGMFFWWYSTKFMFTSIVYIEYLDEKILRNFLICKAYFHRI
jgi:hypothetical protein